MLRFLTLLIDGSTKFVSAITSSQGATDKNKIVATDGNGKLDLSLMPSGLDVATFNAAVSENLSAGDFINIFDDGGTRKVRKADADNNRPAHGFVLSAVAANEQGLIYTKGTNTALTGLSLGSNYYLSNIPGKSASTPVVENNELKSGSLYQELGTAIAANSLEFEYNGVITIE